jgi:hypothetical protein
LNLVYIREEILYPKNQGVIPRGCLGFGLRRGCRNFGVRAVCAGERLDEGEEAAGGVHLSAAPARVQRMSGEAPIVGARGRREREGGARERTGERGWAGMGRKAG